jgi:hypothetical protein
MGTLTHWIAPRTSHSGTMPTDSTLPLINERDRDKARKTLCHKLSRDEIKGVSVTSSDLSDVSDFHEVSRATQAL